MTHRRQPPRRRVAALGPAARPAAGAARRRLGRRARPEAGRRDEHAHRLEIRGDALARAEVRDALTHPGEGAGRVARPSGCAPRISTAWQATTRPTASRCSPRRTISPVRRAESGASEIRSSTPSAWEELAISADTGAASSRASGASACPVQASSDSPFSWVVPGAWSPSVRPVVRRLQEFHHPLVGTGEDGSNRRAARRPSPGRAAASRSSRPRSSAPPRRATIGFSWDAFSSIGDLACREVSASRAAPRIGARLRNVSGSCSRRGSASHR